MFEEWEQNANAYIESEAKYMQELEGLDEALVNELLDYEVTEVVDTSDSSPASNGNDDDDE